MAKKLSKFAAMLVACLLVLSTVIGLTACGSKKISVSLDAASGIKLKLDETADITVTVTEAGKAPESDEENVATVTWASSNSDVVTVSSETSALNGEGKSTITVTAKNSGKSTISATYGGKTATCVVSVTSDYTYHSTFSSSPGKWNPHTWESNTDSIILNYITMGLYDVAYNEDKTGYEFVPEMASALPVDVTSKYVGQYGVKSGDSGKVWEIALNENAVWDDEHRTPINADTYIYSMKEQLNPDMLNRRADSYTGGTTAIYGANTYLYSHTETIYIAASSLYDSLEDAQAAGETVYLDVWDFWNAEGYVDAEGNVVPQYVSLTDTTVYDTADAWEAGEEEDAFSGKDIFDAYYEIYFDFSDCFIATENTNLDDNFEHVGLKKVDDYKIVIAYESEVTEYDVKYSLTSNWIVYEDLYEACKKQLDSLITSTYFTTLATTISYGPYKLTQFVYDQYFVLETNPNWYGYTDGEHEGQYQTTCLDFTFVSGTNAKALTKEMFMKGELEDYSIDGTEMSSYGTSRYLYSEPESYTYQFFMTGNKTFLERETESTGKNHTVIAYEEFRKAISYSISRSAYCSAYQPASQPGFGVLNYMYCIDPTTGALYRETEEAKTVSLLYSGYTVNENGNWVDRNGREYRDLDQAYESISGYNPSYAAELFTEAYNKAKTAGDYEDGQDVEILLGISGSAGANFKASIQDFNNQIAAALPEGTFKSVTIIIDESYGSEDAYWGAVQKGEVDLSFSAWGGSAMDPWGVIFSCYINPSNTLNYGFDSIAKSVDITLTIDGQEITATFYDWASWLNNGQKDEDYTSAENNLYVKLGYAVGKADLDTKVKILAACELEQLNTALNLPIFYSYTNALHSEKYNLGSDEYIQLIGFGGVRYITYNYDDLEWADFVSSRGGNLESFYLAS